MGASRDVLKDYVHGGKLMQVATVASPGSDPYLCSVWYDAHFEPDLVRFISRHDRRHSRNIRLDPRVAGAIVAIPLVGLGQPARGVTFTGVAHELPSCGIDRPVEQFCGRWPQARSAIDPGKLAADATPSQLYEIRITEWTLFDEENFPQQPRQTVPAAS
jgi:uncharacterized protein YhbP (UPF0306 family)